MQESHLKTQKTPTLAVWKFTSCDGCQISLLESHEKMLSFTKIVNLVMFAEISSAKIKGPYDISIVEGSITTEKEKALIYKVREQSAILITIGACATHGGIQALRNFQNIEEYKKIVYASTEYIDTLATSTPISAHVRVDFELQGCPVNPSQLIEVIHSFAQGRRPRISPHSVCTECKAAGLECIAVSQKVPCLGPITQSGCNALCPQFQRGCYGCYGPKENANPKELMHWWQAALHVDAKKREQVLKTFNCAADGFQEDEDGR